MSETHQKIKKAQLYKATNKEKIIKAKKHGYFNREIGKFLGVSKQAIDQKLTKEEKKMIKAYREAWIISLFLR